LKISRFMVDLPEFLPCEKRLNSNNAYLNTLCDGEPSTAALVLAIGSDVGTGNAEICLVTANSSK